VPPSPRLPDDLLIRPQDPRVGAAPSLVMARAVELRRVDAGRASQPVERVVPGQRMRIDTSFASVPALGLSGTGSDGA
jgi:hypothetical protein